MQAILNIMFVLLAVAMVAIILVQRGPGATAGAAFGSGASGTVFGARGASSFLTRATAVIGTLFFVVSLTMAVMAARGVSTPEGDGLGVMERAASGEPAGVLPPALDGVSEPQPGPEAQAGGSDVPVVMDEAADDLPPVDGDAGSDVPDQLPEATPGSGGADGAEALLEDIPSEDPEAVDETAREN